jgi:hypothetical protein
MKTYWKYVIYNNKIVDENKKENLKNYENTNIVDSNCHSRSSGHW